MGRLTQRLAADIDAVAHDQVVSFDELEEAFGNFYDFQIEHLSKENEHFFPLIEQYFNERELTELVSGMGIQADPLFDARHEDFAQLYDYIVECEGEEVD